jgi:hypothetical protein
MNRAHLSLAFGLISGVVWAAGPSFTVVRQGKPVLALTLPANAKAETAGDRTVVIALPEALVFQLWPIADVKTIEAAMPRAADVIKSDFAGFKPGKTNDLTVAGAPAKELAGPGTETDDGDPGQAIVVLFRVGERVFAACVHGEGDAAMRQRAALLAVLQSARTP